MTYLIHRNKNLNFRPWTGLFNENLVYWDSIPLATVSTLHFEISLHSEETNLALTT